MRHIRDAVTEVMGDLFSEARSQQDRRKAHVRKAVMEVFVSNIDAFNQSSQEAIRDWQKKYEDAA